MPKLVWDAVGQHLYETGVDHGVFYPVVNGAYTGGEAWNGLTAVNENPSGADETKLWADNQKYLGLRAAEEYGATIEAYTYPDGFATCDGSATVVAGVKIGQQPRKPFGFVYRSRIGNDTELDSYGYKLHLIYGLTANPSGKNYSTVNDSPEAITFSWEATSTPVNVDGFKPTSNIEIDSTKFDTVEKKALLAALEAKLYGSDGTVSYTEFTGESFVEGVTYYERSGTDPNYVYTPTTDVTPQSGTTYYTKTTTGASDPYLPLPAEVFSTLGYTPSNN